MFHLRMDDNFLWIISGVHLILYTLTPPKAMRSHMLREELCRLFRRFINGELESLVRVD